MTVSLVKPILKDRLWRLELSNTAVQDILKNEPSDKRRFEKDNIYTTEIEHATAMEGNQIFLS